MVNALGGAQGAGPVWLPFQSEKIPVKVTGKIEWIAEKGFGTQPPAGNYLVLDKPLTVNGTSYNKLYMGRTRELLPTGRVSIKGEAYEVAHRVIEGEQRYAVLESSPSDRKPVQQRARG